MNLIEGIGNSEHKELRILILEDVPTDVELIEHELKKGGIVFTSKRVETEDAYRRMLDEFCPDLILSDYHLPTFDGISALMIAMEKCQDVPFIFVSGAMGEELAVEMLKNGATDYVIKDRLSRLVPAIKRALAECTVQRERKQAIDQLREKQVELEAQNEELREAQTELQQSRDKYSELYDFAPVGYFSFDKDGVILQVNITGADMLRIERKILIMKPFSAFVCRESTDLLSSHFRDVFQTGLMQTREITLSQKDDAPLDVLLVSKPVHDEHGHPLLCRSVITDITERKNLENQLLHAQKMAAVGQLAGGVAHDYNNILSAIVNYAYMLQTKVEKDESLKNDVKQITALAMKAADITRGLLAFSRKHIIHPVPLKLNDSVKNMVKLLSKFIGEDIQINIKLTDIEPVVMADSAQVEQIIINLATNARDAMPDGGSLTIETDIAIIDNNFIKLHGFGWPGTYALLVITDTGTGMDEKTRQRIFEPFFTTKEIGKGSGLGLAIIYGIVKQHNGFITADSEPGRGTTFKVYFQTVNAIVSEKEEIKPADAAGNGETLLLAEDEEEVRNSVKVILEKSGYAVIEAANGYTAIEQFREHKDKIDLLLLDVIMPKKNGMEVYEEIKKITPGIKAIFISGYSAEVIDKKGVLKDDLNYITKPVPPDKLLSTIKAVLHNG